MMVGYDLSKHPGNLRPGPIGVYDSAKGKKVYDAPDAEQLPGLIIELTNRLNGQNEDPPLVAGAMAHLNLVLIHPFVDGNGRMSRCLQSLVLARYFSELDPAFLSIEAYLGRNTSDYYDAIDAVAQGSWKPETDTRPWVRFCLKAHYQQALSLRRRVRTYQRLWDTLEIQIKKYRLADRVILALSDAAFGLKVRNATYRKAADLSGQVASRDLTILVQHGLLEMKGRARGAHYVSTNELARIMDECTEPQVIEDPFSLPSIKKQAEPF
jgi:Fic family protein